MRNMLLFFIVIGVLMLSAVFILCILVFHPNTTSIILGLALPLLIFLLIRKKLVQALKMDEPGLEEEKKNESLGRVNLDKPGQFNSPGAIAHPGTVTQNREKLKGFFKTSQDKPSEKLKQNDFSVFSIKDRDAVFPVLQLPTHKHSLDLGFADYSIPYPPPLFLINSAIINTFLKKFFLWNKKNKAKTN